MKPSSYAADKKGKSGIKRIINAFGYSKDGLAAAYRYESAFRQVLWLNLILIVLTFILNFDSATKMLLIIASFVSPSKPPSITLPPKNTNWQNVPKMLAPLRNCSL